MDRPHINHSRHKYVWRDRGHGPELDGYEALPCYGWMWNGASGVKDLKDELSCWHDWGFQVGLFMYKGAMVTLTKRKMNWIYSKHCGKVSRWRRLTRWVGLMAFSGVPYRSARKKLHKLGTTAVVDSDTIPHPEKWEFPTSRTRDAIWKG